MKVAVTGAAGFIGSHLCRALLARGDAVVGLDNFNDFYDPAVKEAAIAPLLGQPGFSLIRGDLLDDGARAALLADPPDVIVHLAAWGGVRPSIEQPLRYTANNIEATTRLLEDARSLAAPPRFIYASSSSVYGDRGEVPFSEDDRVERPISPYAATKRACELLGYTWHHLYGLDVTCLRFFTVYGPGQRPDLAIHKFARLMLAGEKIPRYGDGSTARDYTFVDDIVAGVMAAMDKCAGYHVYNLGNSSPVSLNELIAKIGAALGVEPDVEELPDQRGDVRITYADISRAQAELGWSPETSLEDGLARFAEWVSKVR
jgi:UDP-glucuronate 4-epimerase